MSERGVNRCSFMQYAIQILSPHMVHRMCVNAWSTFTLPFHFKIYRFVSSQCFEFSCSLLSEYYSKYLCRYMRRLGLYVGLFTLDGHCPDASLSHYIPFNEASQED